jgi:hypothetical protein
MENREGLRQKGTTGVKKQFVAIGGKYHFQKGGGG